MTLLQQHHQRRLPKTNYGHCIKFSTCAKQNFKCFLFGVRKSFPALAVKGRWLSSVADRVRGFAALGRRRNSSFVGSAVKNAGGFITNCPTCWSPIDGMSRRVSSVRWKIQRRQAWRRMNPRYIAGGNGSRLGPCMQPVVYVRSPSGFRFLCRVRPAPHSLHSIGSDVLWATPQVGWRVLSDRLPIYICGYIPVPPSCPRGKALLSYQTLRKEA